MAELYATKTLPNGMKIDFYKGDSDDSPPFWKIPKLDTFGHFMGGETPDECMQRVYNEVLDGEERARV